MNIVFEGVNGSGKTTAINGLIKFLNKKGVKYNYISDLETDTPLNSVLQKMFSDSVFLELNQEFKTSLFESLVLAADHHYIQEMHRKDKGIIIYDRDFISVLAYQKDIIKKEYEDWENFFNPFREIMTYQLKNIDLLCYVSVPIEENIRRTEVRDNRKFSEEEKQIIINLKNNMEEEIENFCRKTNTPCLSIDGRAPAEDITRQILNGIKEVKNNSKHENKEKTM